jgi:hypothetical protein
MAKAEDVWQQPLPGTLPVSADAGAITRLAAFNGSPQDLLDAYFALALELRRWTDNIES